MVYLDNAATTKPKFFRSNYTDYWENSNTPYTLGMEQNALENSKDRIKKCLQVTSGKILFFCCASTAIEWLESQFPSGTMWCSSYEHESVQDLCTKEEFYTEGCMLYCHQLVNQITGDIWDIKQKAKIIASINDKAFFGVDMTSAIGHITIPNDLETYCDALWFSGHKFYTEKNIGCMWISDRLATFLGATQDAKNQYGLIHGTIDVQGAIMIADAFEFVCNCDDYSYNTMIQTLIKGLAERNIQSKIISISKNKTYYINAIHLNGINATALQTYLAYIEGIHIGIGHSACDSEENYRVLINMGLSAKEASETIRISFGIDNNAIDIIHLINGIIKFKEKFIDENY